MTTEPELYIPNWLPAMESAIREILGEGEDVSPGLAVLLCRNDSRKLWSFAEQGQ
jgi:hypothetical protein